jgi:hypothetical protein
MCLSTRPTSKWHSVPKFSKLGLSWLWSPIIFCVDLWLRWGVKQSYSPCWELFNNMLHATCTQGNRVDFWLLVGESQTINLTPCLSFGYNLCFKCPNESCEPILNIYVLRAFQWYKECLNPMNFDPCNRSLKIRESIWDSNSHNGSSFESVRVHSLTLFCTLGITRCNYWASLLARNLASPCFGCKPKTKVTTEKMLQVGGWSIVFLLSKHALCWCHL